jgi:hypothetical protein
VKLEGWAGASEMNKSSGSGRQHGEGRQEKNNAFALGAVVPDWSKGLHEGGELSGKNTGTCFRSLCCCEKCGCCPECPGSCI